MNYRELTRRFEAGARIEQVGDGVPGNGSSPLFAALAPYGDLRVITANGAAGVESGERAICLTGPS